MKMDKKGLFTNNVKFFYNLKNYINYVKLFYNSLCYCQVNANFFEDVIILLQIIKSRID